MKVIISALFGLILTSALPLNIYAQDVLFTIEDEEVSVAEFERVYTKNNINNQADYSKASLDEYINLYVKFRLKVMEASNLQMDTIEALQNELGSYRKQLTKNYLNDKEVTDNLIKEAYNRLKEEVDASHILVQWPSANPTAADSAQVLKEIKSIAKQAKSKDFGKLAEQFSEDPSAKQNQGHLGYLTAFQTVYPFESAMYNTAVGSVSQPVATRFGYHLVMVHDKRPARGKMVTAHILIKGKNTDTDAQKIAAEKKVSAIYQELINNVKSFDVAVKEYSEDKKSKFQGGKLPELGGNEMLNEYAEAAFSLKNDGDFSMPIQTELGWHIVQRISLKELGSYESVEAELRKRVERDTRSKVAEDIMIADTKAQFGYKVRNDNKTAVIAAMAKGFEKGKFDIVDRESYNKPILSIGSASYTQADFIKYIEKYFHRNTKSEMVESVLNDNFKKFEKQKLVSYREDHLEEINIDFKNLMQEYHDGILLFELTNEEVWNKAVEDTTGLRAFHNDRKMDYMWDKRVQYTTYSTKDEKAAIKLEKFVSKGWATSKIVAKLNKKEELVKVQTYKQQESNNSLSEDLVWEKGFVLKETGDNNSVMISVVDKVLEPMPKELSETRGYVISDYQDFLEKEWISRLEKKYAVNIDWDVLYSLIKK